MAESGGKYEPTQEEITAVAKAISDSYKEEAQEAREVIGTTQPFEPARSSTPYHRGEEVQMQTMQHEQTGLPSYEETSFDGDERTPLIEEDSVEDIEMRLSQLRENRETGLLDISKIPNPKENFLPKEVQNEQKQRAKRFIKNRYPDFDEDSLKIVYSKDNPLELVAIGPRGGKIQIFLKDGSDFHDSFLGKKYVQNALGKPSETKIKEASDDIKKKQQELNKLRQDEKRFLAQKEKKKKKKNLIYDDAYGWKKKNVNSFKTIQT